MLAYSHFQRREARISGRLLCSGHGFLRDLAFGLIVCVFVSLLHSPASLQAQTTADINTNTAPDPVKLALDRARALHAEKKSEEALEMLDRGLKSAPRDLQLRFLKAIIQSDIGKLKEATAGFETLNQDFPEVPEPYNNLAVLLAGQGELDRARYLLERAIQAAPHYALAHENLGDVYLRLAQQSYQEASKKAPSLASARKKLEMSTRWLTESGQ